MTAQSEIHNLVAGEIVAKIVREVMRPGGEGKTEDIMVLTESVVVGIALACSRLGGDEKVLDVMFDSAKKRLAEIRMKDIDTKGRA